MGWPLTSAAASIASPVAQPASDPSTNAIVSLMFSFVEPCPAKPERPIVSTARWNTSESARTGNPVWNAAHPVSSTAQMANTAVDRVSSAQPGLGWITPLAPQSESVPMTNTVREPVATEAHAPAKAGMGARIQLKAGKGTNKEKSASPPNEIPVQALPVATAPSSVPLLPVVPGPPPANLATQSLAELPEDPTFQSENSDPCSGGDKADGQRLTLALPDRAKRETNPDRPVEMTDAGDFTETAGPAKHTERASEKSTTPMKGVVSSVSAPAVRAVNPNPAEPMTVAFQGRLVPTAPPTGTTKTDHSETSSKYTTSLDRMTWVSERASVATATLPENVVGSVIASARTTPHEQEEPSQGSAESPDDHVTPKQKAKPLTPALPDPEPSVPAIDRAPVAVERPSSPGEAPKRTEPPATVRATEPAAPELPKVPTAKHDIKLEVNNGDQKVEIHLSQKGSDVHVAVRTPDTHLAGELRENLPTLSSRLQRTGLKAEDWNTATPDGQLRRGPERSAASDSNDPNHQSRNNRQQQQQERKQDTEQRQPKTIEIQSTRKQKGKEFSWFMSSLH